jgi:hypothetical protein
MTIRQTSIFRNALLLLAVAVLSFPAGCSRSPSLVIRSNSVAVRRATSNEVVLIVHAKASSRVWSEYHFDQSGFYSVPQNDIETIVTYRIEKKGYSIAGQGGIYNTKATDVSFHDTLLVTNNMVEIGTYSQWGQTGNRIVFKLE